MLSAPLSEGRAGPNRTDWTRSAHIFTLSLTTMFQHSNNKKCFTIEALVGKEAISHGGGGGGSGDEPIRPTALRFPESLHPAAAAAAGVFGSCFQGSSGRTLYSAGPDLVLQEPGPHTQSPGGLPLHPLQIPPQSFFSPQHRDALSFYPWVLRSRYLGHRFQGRDGRDGGRFWF
ncbi:Homeobox protein EMX1 [Collichthys lucidus]|uniref:Homeobox protein EMX1 n=1 Tax=Collichthys lucidus TaxID=240159 RepID=A0A4U5UEI8_COLLU|nr:Homeobox protein EMX1 [Collichthys lucidus]